MNKDEIKFELACGASMSAQEAERMLVRLRGHFKEPVQPVSRYCDSLRAWQKALQERARSLRNELFPELEKRWSEEAHDAYRQEMDNPTSGGRTYKIQELKRFQDACDSVDYTFLQIIKSSLLGRLIYGGEKLRTQQCPEHKGEWSGLEHPDRPCPHGCEMTGWIPER